MNFASDFWRSKQTWNGLLAVANTAATAIFNKPEWLPYIALVHGALAAIFARDTTAKGIEATKENTEAIRALPESLSPPISAIPATEIQQLEQIVGFRAEQGIDKEVVMKLIEELAKSYPAPAIEALLKQMAREDQADSDSISSPFNLARSDRDREVKVP